MRVIVTRPQGDAQRWVLALERHGIAALALPLIDIRPLSDARAVAAAWRSWRDYDAVMFVSTPAVEHFFAQQPPAVDATADGSGPRCWAPGPGTVAALLRHGVAPQQIDAPAPDSGQFDSEALWRGVAQQVRPGWRVLVVRGAAHDLEATASGAPGPPADGSGARGQGREWLAGQLRRAGAQVDFAAAYWRSPPEPQRLRRAVAEHAIDRDDLWLFTSAQAIDHLRAGLAGQDWSQARAIATHPRIAVHARAAGFAVVWESRPALDDIVASIKSLG